MMIQRLPMICMLPNSGGLSAASCAAQRTLIMPEFADLATP
ncbi:hypothetical protein THITH_09905 [Thioalkalivibrio paradoxus ARh 1]|uniref:Uncharacterized protein n=1 Tax=Thioalkalivibrio paradoxus ARh 1 TaxID=713585 RepID=W0DNT5_9GAMM|nr:hypothetical protein THITH_09905 [Thioalkalivibrio paradoxus ARh 1]